MIIIEPVGGLANRMRVIASAIKIKQKYNCDIKCFWVENEDLNAPFNSLFHAIEEISVIEKPLKYQYLRSVVNKSFLKKKMIGLFNKVLSVDVYIRDADYKQKTWKDEIDIESIMKRGKNLYINTCEEFYPNNDVYDYFVLKKELEDELKTITNRFSSNTFGIHIRRTDNLHSIENSPLELFVKKINELIKIDEHVSFFLSTDDLSVQKEFKNLFGDKIIYHEKEFSRKSLQGMLDAVIDMYALSKTKKIYGSFWSSFSIIAARIGKIEFEEIKI